MVLSYLSFIFSLNKNTPVEVRMAVNIKASNIFLFEGGFLMHLVMNIKKILKVNANQIPLVSLRIIGGSDNKKAIKGSVFPFKDELSSNKEKAIMDIKAQAVA
jgi:hypothetical protein